VGWEEVGADLLHTLMLSVQSFPMVNGTKQNYRNFRIWSFSSLANITPKQMVPKQMLENSLDSPHLSDK